MNGLNSVLLSILLIMCIILIIFLVLVCIKVLSATDKVNIILNDVEGKLKSVNKVFNVIDGVTDTLSSFSDALVNKIIQLFGSIFKKKKEENKDE